MPIEAEAPLLPGLVEVSEPVGLRAPVLSVAVTDAPGDPPVTEAGTVLRCNQ